MPENNTQVQAPAEQNTNQQLADTTGENKPAENKEPEKTFTQAEVNELVKSRLERERKNMPSKDELAAFKKWQEEQQTTEEKHANALKAEQQKAIDAESRANEFEAKYTAMAKGVKPEAVDDVIALARAKVSDDVTFEQKRIILSQLIDCIEIGRDYTIAVRLNASYEQFCGWECKM